MKFSEAFEEAQKGKGMRMRQWNDDVVVRVQSPDKYSKMSAPYLYVDSRFGRVPWISTNIELFSDNWEVID